MDENNNGHRAPKQFTEDEVREMYNENRKLHRLLNSQDRRFRDDIAKETMLTLLESGLDNMIGLEDDDIKELAEASYKIADQMIEARKSKE